MGGEATTEIHTVSKISNYQLGEVLRQARQAKDLGVRELCRVIERNPNTGLKVSYSYYSQVENGANLRPEKISMDFFWAVGIVLGIDPLKLFVLSRPQIPRDFVDAKKRDRFFPSR